MSLDSDEVRARRAVDARSATSEEVVPAERATLSGSAGRDLVVEGPLRPVASPSVLVESMKTFEAIKKALLTIDQDTYRIDGKDRIAKSGWRKLALAFGISDEIIHEEQVVDDTGDKPYIVWHIRVRVTAAGGRSVEGIGTASSRERNFAHVEHDLHALAHTRAKSRAIADMLGSSDKVYEEDDGDEPARAPSPSASVDKKAKMLSHLEEILGPIVAKEVQVVTGEKGYDLVMPRTANPEDGELFCERMKMMGHVVKKDDRGAFVVVTDK